MKGDRERCLAAGMDAYLSKPLQAGELARLLLELFPPTMKHDTPTPPFDRAELLDRVGGHEEVLREVVGLFLDEAPRLLAAVRDAVGRRDAVALGRSAHALKGTVASLAAAESAETAARLEALARTGDLAGADTLWADLERQVGRLREALARAGQEAAA